MALPQKSTLGEMRSELLSRIGFGSQGAQGGNLVPTVDSFLKRSQEYLYWKYDFLELNQIYDWTMNVGQTLYDWPDNMEPRNAMNMRTLFNTIWQPLEEGIEFQHDTNVSTRYYPRLFDRKAQLEVWPEPDQQYTLRCDHYARLGDFKQDGDRCTIDETLLFAYTLAKLKRHYRHPDAQDYLDEASDLLRKYRTANHGDKRYKLGATPDENAIPPRVV